MLNVKILVFIRSESDVICIAFLFKRRQEAYSGEQLQATNLNSAFSTPNLHEPYKVKFSFLYTFTQTIFMNWQKNVM